MSTTPTIKPSNITKFKACKEGDECDPHYECRLGYCRKIRVFACEKHDDCKYTLRPEDRGYKPSCDPIFW